MSGRAVVPSARTARRRVLVVVDDACTAPDLPTGVRVHVGPGPIEALVLAPACDTAATRWYVDCDAARADAAYRLRACVARLAREGIQANGALGDPDPVQAIAEALSEFPADEILLVSTPERPSDLLRRRVVDSARSSFRQPVAHVELRSPGRSPAGPSARERRSFGGEERDMR